MVERYIASVVFASVVRIPLKLLGIKINTINKFVHRIYYTECQAIVYWNYQHITHMQHRNGTLVSNIIHNTQLLYIKFLWFPQSQLSIFCKSSYQVLMRMMSYPNWIFFMNLKVM